MTRRHLPYNRQGGLEMLSSPNNPQAETKTDASLIIERRSWTKDRKRAEFNQSRFNKK